MDKPAIWVWAVVVGGLVGCGLLAYAPLAVPGVDSIIFHKLFWAAVYAHMIEAAVVGVLAKRSGLPALGWAVRVVFLGSFGIQAYLKSQGSKRNAIVPGFSLFFAVLVLLWLV